MYWLALPQDVGGLVIGDLGIRLRSRKKSLAGSDENGFALWHRLVLGSHRGGEVARNAGKLVLQRSTKIVNKTDLDTALGRRVELYTELGA